MIRPIVAKFRTYEEADQATLEYYRHLSPAERLEILFQLRSFAHKDTDESSRRLARVIESLNSSGVEYLIVGAIALAYHGFPCYTGDLDILVRISPENAQRLGVALSSFAFGNVGLQAEDFLDSCWVIQLGVPPNRVDVPTSLTGVSFDEAWTGRVEGDLEGMYAKFIGRPALVKNKRSTGRLRDRADLEALAPEE